MTRLLELAPDSCLVENVVAESLQASISGSHVNVFRLGENPASYVCFIYVGCEANVTLSMSRHWDQKTMKQFL